MTPIKQDIARMSRRAIVQYSGVVRDFNPVHYDDEFARKLGLPGVIAQGPLTVTLVLDALVASLGAERIGGLKMRLKAPVFPGDQLSLACDDKGNLAARVGDKEVLSGTLELKD
jgi:acyl dehydratase